MTHTIEVLQEDIDNAVNSLNKFTICTGCIVARALNRTFKGEQFEVVFAHAISDKLKLLLSNEAKLITYISNTNEWKNVKPFTFTATEY